MGEFGDIPATRGCAAFVHVMQCTGAQHCHEGRTAQTAQGSGTVPNSAQGSVLFELLGFVGLSAIGSVRVSGSRIQ